MRIPKEKDKIACILRKKALEYNGGNIMEKITFEQAVAELEKITAELESGNAELEKSLVLFE